KALYGRHLRKIHLLTGPWCTIGSQPPSACGRNRKATHRGALRPGGALQWDGFLRQFLRAVRSRSCVFGFTPSQGGGSRVSEDTCPSWDHFYRPRRRGCPVATRPYPCGRGRHGGSKGCVRYLLCALERTGWRHSNFQKGKSGLSESVSECRSSNWCLI